MKRHILYFITVSVAIAQLVSCALAASSSSTPVNIAIKKYKNGNYTGCLQDCQAIVRRDPSNALAYYYLAMAYSQAGNKDKAVENYSKVLSLSPNPRLSDYAATGKRCLETPDKCQPDTGESATEVDKLINSQTDIMTSKVRQEFNQKNLDRVKNEINNDAEMDAYKLRKFDDYSKNRSQGEATDKAAQKTPSNDEVVAALKVLSAAGVNPYAQQLANVSVPQNAEMAQLEMMMGNSGQNNNNSMSNMIPFMLAQNKNGTSSYSPQMMQAMMVNSMLPNLNFNVDNDNK